MKTLLSTLFLVVFLAPMAAPETVWENIKLNADTTLELQNEEQIAINPTNPANMVCVWRDFRLGYRQIGWGYTFDGGATWTDGGLLVEPNYQFQSDPGVTADNQGVFYAVVLSSDGTWGNGLYVLRSADGGISWGPPLEVISHVPDTFEDKEFIACDRTDGPHAGNLYVVWNRFILDPASTQIIMSRSTDSGLSWSDIVPVSEVIDVHYPIPVVGSEGELYVAWSEVEWFEPGPENSIKIDVSIDGGVTFGTDHKVTDVLTSSVLINGGILAYSSPHMDADITGGPYSGRLYVSFMDQRDGYGDYDIWVTGSDDHAVTWSTPVRINDDLPDNGCDQFHPWLTVDNTGIVTVAFLDRRDDPGNLSYHCYLTQSVDGGTTWSANVRISTEPSNPLFALRDPVPAPDRAAFDVKTRDPGHPLRAPMAGLLGEYIGVVAHDGVPTPVWTDIRNGNQDVFAGYCDDDVAVLIQRFEATVKEGTVHLEWDLVADETVAGFNVYRREEHGGSERKINRGGLIPGTSRSYEDTDIEPGGSYSYTLAAVMADEREIRSAGVAVETIPCGLALGCSYPNPFNPATTITYSIPLSGFVNLRIYDVLGRLVDVLVSRYERAGEHSVKWNGTGTDGSAVTSGVYIVRLESGGRVETGKILLLK